MNFAAVAALALLLVRPSMLVLATPFLGAVNAPVQARVGITLILAVILAPFVTVPSNLPLTGLAVVVLREAAIGLAIALAIQVLIAGADFAGQFIGFQIGLSLGALIDPQSGVRNNVLALLYANLATVICFSIGAHHALLRALADSYRALPVGLGGVDPSLGANVGRLLGLVFVIGVRIAAPVIAVLLLVELAIGLLSRVAPSLNVITAGASARAIVGLLVMAAALTTLPGLIDRYLPTALRAAADMAGAFR
jgi:flagellar biosynthetic protein FliR